MTLKEVIKKSIQKYFDGMEPESLKKSSSKRLKYNKKFFDKFGEDRGIKPYGFKEEDS